MIKRVFLGENLQNRIDRSDARLRRVLSEEQAFLSGEISKAEWEYLEGDRRNSHMHSASLIFSELTPSDILISRSLAMKLFSFLTTLYVHDQNPHLRALLRARGMKPAAELFVPEI